MSIRQPGNHSAD